MEFEISDIAVAAFLLMKGLKLNSAENRGGKYNFVFADPEKLASKFCLEYINSDCQQFDSYMRVLRTMVREKK